MNNNQKEELLALGIKVAMFTLSACIIVLAGMYGYSKFLLVKSPSTLISSFFNKENEEEEKEGSENEELEHIQKNIAVFGTDIGGRRTDVIFVVNFDSETNEVNVVNVPRDTKVNWTSEQRKNLQALGKGAPYTTKINEMTSYGGMENIRDFTVNQLETMFGIEIDNYVVVSLDAFRQIVDAVGGVEMHVPQNMYYVDKYQDLYIDLKEGYQHLDGKEAEQLVRFRRYPEGDVARVRTQQLFLEAFAKQVLSPSIIPRIPTIAKTLFDVVNTDFNLMDIAKYYPYMKQVESINVKFHLLPGAGQYENGVSYFFPNEAEMQPMIQEAFFSQPSQEEIQAEYEKKLAEVETVVDYTVSIQVLNGNGTPGVAAQAKKKLEAEGYKVSDIGDYQTMGIANTLIKVTDLKYAKQFLEYYPDAMIEEVSDMEYDVQIVIGLK